jgi:hypothetical protein
VGDFEHLPLALPAKPIGSPALVCGQDRTARPGEGGDRCRIQTTEPDMHGLIESFRWFTHAYRGLQFENSGSAEPRERAAHRLRG